MFWVPAWAFGGFISTVGDMFVADCMLQAGVSNHVVGILDDRASDALPGSCFWSFCPCFGSLLGLSGVSF